MSIFSLISDLFEPAAKLVDDLHTSSEEKLLLKNQFAEIENSVLVNVLSFEKQLISLKSSLISSEASGDSWLQRNWRPITMLSFLCLVIFDSFGLLSFRLSSDAWTLLKIGLGGYVVGRSAEKILPNILHFQNSKK